MSERSQRFGVLILVVVAVALVFVASAVRSYVPLFFVWVPQFAIPVFLSRAGRGSPTPTSAPAPRSSEPAGDAPTGSSPDHSPEERGTPPED
jgi:hypothetical protein